jgi:hypothetical protein
MFTNLYLLILPCYIFLDKGMKWANRRQKAKIKNKILPIMNKSVQLRLSNIRKLEKMYWSKIETNSIGLWSHEEDDFGLLFQTSFLLVSQYSFNPNHIWEIFKDTSMLCGNTSIFTYFLILIPIRKTKGTQHDTSYLAMAKLRYEKHFIKRTISGFYLQHEK